MGKGARITVAAALVLALAGLATWWLLAGRGEDASLASRSPASTSIATLPVAESLDAARGAPVPLALDDSASSALPEDAAAAAAQPGNPVTFTGRVIDDAGRPVQDAEVVHLPSDLMREAAGLSDPRKDWYVPWERLTRARTDGQGRFTLPTRELPLGDTPLLDFEDGNGMTSGSIDGSLPRLLVLHPALEPTLFDAFAFARGGSDVGDLVVAACGAVTGRLVDESGQPLPGAAVRLSTGGSSARQPRDWWILRELPRTSTGSDGRFLFGGLWNAALSIELNPEDCVLQRKDVLLRPRETVDLGDIVMERGGAIAGWVLAEGGTPIGGARITVRMALGPPHVSTPDAATIEDSMTVWYSGQGYEVHAVSAADGGFRVGGLSSDLDKGWRVIVAAAGYEAALQSEVKPGSEPLRFELKPMAGIRLRVLEPGGAAAVADVAVVSASRVLDTPETGPNPWTIAIGAAREGEAWHLLGAGPDRNEAIISAPGHATTGFALPGVAPGATLEHSVELPPESVIAGRVLDDHGAPVAGATVRGVPPADLPMKLPPQRAKTDADGRFELRGLAAGRWTVGVSALGCVPAPPVLLTPAPGERIGDVEFELARGGSIAGRILAADVQAAVGNMVLARPVENTQPPALAQAAAFVIGQTDAAEGDQPAAVTFKSVIDDRGEYLIEGLPPGDYQVTCHPGAAGLASVTAGERTRLDLAPRALPRLRGRVTSAGVPVADAKVVVINTSGNFSMDGKTTTTNAAGEYEVTLDGEGPAHGAEVFAQWQRVKTRDVRIDPHFDQAEVADLAFGGGVLEGEVVDEGGAPMPVHVKWVSEAREGFAQDDGVEASADTAANGHFRMDLLPEGKGLLLASKGSYVGVTLRDVAVHEGQTTKVPRIVLRLGGSIEVHVGGTADDKHDPMKRYLIRVRSLADAEWGSKEIRVSFGATQTMRGIPPGPVEIDVERPVGPQKFESLRTVPAVVVAGEITRFDQPADG